MGKNPAFQFYPNDWLSDPQLQMTNIGTKGIWIQLLCYMWWSPNRGEVSGTIDDLCRLAGCKQVDMECFLKENDQYHFADVTERNKIVTVSNRRMIREQKARESTRLRVTRFRNAHGNANITVPSPNTPSTSSPSTPSSSTKKEQRLLANPDGFAAFWAAYPRKEGKAKAMKAWAKLQPQNGLVQTILSALTLHASRWTDPQYIPHPATWLTGRRWEDQLDVPIATSASLLTPRTQRNIEVLRRLGERHGRS